MLIVRGWSPGLDRFTENSRILTVKGNDGGGGGGGGGGHALGPPPQKK